MSAFQKVIKYCAIGFAAFLIVMIFSAIAGVGQGIFTLGGFINRAERVSLDGYDSYLSINIGAADLQIKTGDELKAETNNEKIKINQSENKLEITEEGSWFNFGKKEITVYIPKDYTFDLIDIKSGAGRVHASDLRAQDFYLSLGAGESVIEKVVAEKPEISTGAGKLSINSGDLKDLKLDIGVGEVSISAILLGDNRINCGIGKLSLNLGLDESAYKISAHKGIGAINFNGTSLANDTVIGDGPNSVLLEGGIGDIDIRTSSPTIIIEDFSKEDQAKENPDE